MLAVVAAVLLAGCSLGEKTSPKDSEGSYTSISSESGKPQIIATLFPQFDFARHIAKDMADVVLLLPPGVESHSYEPSPSEILKMHNADVLLYTGESMEAWSHKLVESLEDSGSDCLVVDVSKGITLTRTEDIEAEMNRKNAESDEHDNHEENNHEDEAAEDDHQGEEAASHSHVYDPHIWTNPQLAKVMVDNILEALCSADPQNAEEYRANASAYKQELDALDQEFKEIIENGEQKEVIFGSRFAFYYFTKRYNLTYQSAFDSCSAETEPSVKRMKELIDEIRRENIPAIFYSEMEEPKTARFISNETGAKMLMLHSCHNVTKDEWENGETYLSLMKQNAINLKEGLNR